MIDILLPFMEHGPKVSERHTPMCALHPSSVSSHHTKRSQLCQSNLKPVRDGVHICEGVVL